MNIKISEKAVLYRINKMTVNNNVNTIGSHIRKERMAQGLKQELVCKDICSVSYYSRIESNKIIPANVYVTKIFKKLNKPIPKNLLNNYQIQNKEIINNFLIAIEYKNDKAMEDEYQKILKIPEIYTELYEFVYYIYHRKVEDLDGIIQKLHSQQIHFDNEELILYLENMGIYYVLKEDITYAEKYLNYTMKLQSHMNIVKPSILYRYAWILGKLNNDYKCISYAEEADELFLREHNVYRSVQCKLLIAIKLSKYFPQKAISIYKDCLKITIHSSFVVLNKIIKFNLALVYKKYKQYNKSEDIFLNLINEYHNDLEFILDLYVELIDLHILNNNMDLARDNFMIFNDHQLNYEGHSLYVKYFQYKLYDHELKDTINMYNKLFIPYFSKMNNFIMLIRSRRDLANLYELSGDLQACINELKIIDNLHNNEKIIEI